MEWEEAGKPNSQQVSGNSTSGVPQPDSRGKKKKRNVIIIVVVVLLLIAGISRIGSCGSSSKNYVDWPTSGLATQLPKPDSSKIKVSTNSDSKLSVDVDDFGQDAYTKYVESCKEKGFTVDAKTETSSYEAYNADGYHLKLYVSSSTKNMDINLEAPVKSETITWPTSGPASLLPKPASDKGSVSVNSSTQFTAKITGMSKDAFEAYASEVSSAGFNVDFSKSDTVYQASNADGVKVYINYEGNNQMSISASAAKDSSTSSSSSSTSKSDNSSSKSSSSDSSSSKSSDSSSVGSKVKEAVSNATSSAVSADFKDIMDSYESFMNKYCDFMETYNESSDPAAMLDDYNAIAAEELEWANKVNAYDQNSLSAADKAYYLEVTARVEKRLLEVSK